MRHGGSLFLRRYRRNSFCSLERPRTTRQRFLPRLRPRKFLQQTHPPHSRRRLMDLRHRTRDNEKVRKKRSERKALRKCWGSQRCNKCKKPALIQSPNYAPMLQTKLVICARRHGGVVVDKADGHEICFWVEKKRKCFEELSTDSTKIESACVLWRERECVGVCFVYWLYENWECVCAVLRRESVWVCVLCVRVCARGEMRCSVWLQATEFRPMFVYTNHSLLLDYIGPGIAETGHKMKRKKSCCSLKINHE